MQFGQFGNAGAHALGTAVMPLVIGTAVLLLAASITAMLARLSCSSR